ncbi:MAG: ABC transporter substrate-binding protein [Candidatus Thorarchaeota archaeon]
MTKKRNLMILIFLLSLTSIQFSNFYAINDVKPKVLSSDLNKRVFSSYPLSVTDGYDRNVTFIQEPQSIISIAPSATEVIYAVGAGDKVIATDPYSNYPGETASLPKITNFPSLDIEAILTYNPDVVFGAGITSQDDIGLMEDQGLTVFILAPFDIDDVLENIEITGLITNHESESNLLKSSLQERIDSIIQNVTSLTFKPKIYLEASSDPFLYTYGKGTYGHDLIELAGGINIAENATGLYPQINNEFVITQNPDLILYSKGPWTTTNISTISNRTGWNTINAVKNGHIYPINEDWVSRGGPRIVNALEEIHSKVSLVASPSDYTSNNLVAIEWHWIIMLVSITLVVSFKRRYVTQR